MSGEPPVVDVLGADLSRLVVVAGHLFGGADVDLAVIGGLAMVCRCSSDVRATSDVDTVSGPEGAVGVVRALGAGSLVSDGEPLTVREGTATGSVGGVRVVVTQDAGALRVDGVKLDIIPTYVVSGDDLEGIDAKSRLFLAAHRWALETATPVILRTRGARATLRVARPPAMVAMKLHALQDRRSGRPAKAASDTEDLVRLLVEHNAGRELAAELASAPYGLAALVAEAAQRLLIDESILRLRSLRVDGGSTAAGIDADLLVDVSTQLVNGLHGHDVGRGSDG